MYVPSATFVTSKVNEPFVPEQVVGLVPDVLLNTGNAFTVTVVVAVHPLTSV